MLYLGTPWNSPPIIIPPYERLAKLQRSVASAGEPSDEDRQPVVQLVR